MNHTPQLSLHLKQPGWLPAAALSWAAYLLAPAPAWLLIAVTLSSLIIVSFFWTLSLQRGLSFSRHLESEWLTVGQILPETCRLANRGWAPALWLKIQDASTLPQYVLPPVQTLRGFETHTWGNHHLCRRRGVFALGPTTLRSGDPMGIFEVSGESINSFSLTITPATLPLQPFHFPTSGHLEAETSNPYSLIQLVQADTVRDYHHGDSRRLIHWPSTARRQQLTVRQLAHSTGSNWWLIADLAASAHPQANTFEDAITLTASLAEQGLQQAGRRVGLGAAGRKLLWLPPQSGRDQQHRLMLALAQVEAGSLELTDLLQRSESLLGTQHTLIVITADTHLNWLPPLWRLKQRGLSISVLLLEPRSYGQPNEADPLVQALLTNGIQVELITADLFQYHRIDHTFDEPHNPPPKPGG